MQFLVGSMQPSLEGWRSRGVHPEAPRELLRDPFHDRLVVTLAFEPPGPPLPDGAFQRVEESILSYRIFGSEIGRPVTDRVPVEEGDTIGLDYAFLGPLRLFFASRVVRTFHREETSRGVRSGFVYQTLEGHPELGEEIFEVSKVETGAVKFRIEAWSRPNLWYVKLFTPWARAIQRRAALSAAGRLLGSAQRRHGF